MGGGNFSANCSRHSSVDEDRSARESINFGENCFDLSRAEITSSLSRWESFSNILCVFTRFLNTFCMLCVMFFCQVHKKISGVLWILLGNLCYHPFFYLLTKKSALLSIKLNSIYFCTQSSFMIVFIIKSWNSMFFYLLTFNVIQFPKIVGFCREIFRCVRTPSYENDCGLVFS